MKLKEGFVLRTFSGQTVVVPIKDDLDLNMMIKLNETGKFLWENMQEECSAVVLTAHLLCEYDVDEDTAKKSVEAFIAKLEQNGLLT